MIRSTFFTVRDSAPIAVVGLRDAQGGARDFKIDPPAKIVSFVLRPSEREGVIHVAIGGAEAGERRMDVPEGSASADFGDAFAETPPILWKLGALAAGGALAWLLLAGHK